MNWDNVIAAVKSSAPLLASVLAGGGPTGFAAQALVAKVLGTDAKPEAVMRELSDPYGPAMMKIQELEKTNALEFARMALESERIQSNDRINARNTNSNSDMPALIVIALTIMAGIYGYSLMIFDIQEENRQLITVFATQLLTLWGGAVAYWVGTNKKNPENIKT
ncbi:MAG: hypothetical protein AXW14_08485 [Alteromonas sp. Nap_26]|nr:MAG: hypothetical protein AXW14_08485 [Alteromonas sp. Nap_26]